MLRTGSSFPPFLAPRQERRGGHRFPVSALALSQAQCSSIHMRAHLVVWWSRHARRAMLDRKQAARQVSSTPFFVPTPSVGFAIL